MARTVLKTPSGVPAVDRLAERLTVAPDVETVEHLMGELRTAIRAHIYPGVVLIDYERIPKFPEAVADRVARRGNQGF